MDRRTSERARTEGEDVDLQDLFRSAQGRDPRGGDWLTFAGNELARFLGTHRSHASSPAATVEYRPGPCDDPCGGVSSDDTSGRFACLDTGRRTSWLLVRAPQLSRFPLTIPVASVGGLVRILERLERRESPMNLALLDREHTEDAPPA